MQTNKQKRLDHPDHFHHNQPASVAALRSLIGIRRNADRLPSGTLIEFTRIRNWLYCDNCRQLFWFHPTELQRIANQLIREDDLTRMRPFLRPRFRYRMETLDDIATQTKIKCLCSTDMEPGTRIATFSYRKALDFPMFQKSWLAAEELLRGADRWVFVGYSLPAADYEFKYLLKRIQISRSIQPRFVIISGGSKVDLRKTYVNYQRFFGDRISKANFFASGLTQEAIAAACN